MMKIVKKYLVPNQENDYKPHLIRKAGLGGVLVIAFVLFAMGVLQNVVLLKTDFLSAVLPRVLIDLANENRVENRLAALAANPILEDAAQRKANDMAEKSYFAHNSPDGTTPWYWFRAAGYQFAYAGENLAVNFTDSKDVDDAWMASPGHRANILNEKFTEVGIATAKGMYKGRETVFVVQMFGRPMEGRVTAQEPASPVLAVSEESENLSAEEEQTVVLGETVAVLPATASEQVIVETDTYIEVVNPDAAESTEASEQASNSATGQNSTELEKLLVQPKRVVGALYALLAALLILVIVLTIVIEARRQHPRNVLAAVVVLAVVLVLSYLYRSVFFSGVLVI